jgi:hypothetical protein
MEWGIKSGKKNQNNRARMFDFKIEGQNRESYKIEVPKMQLNLKFLFIM